MAEGSKIAPCDVHVLVDGDSADRSVVYCAICDAWICEICSDDLVKRAKAWGIRMYKQNEADTKS